MEETIRLGSGYVVLCVEALATVAVAYGTIEAMFWLAQKAGEKAAGFLASLRARRFYRAMS